MQNFIAGQSTVATPMFTTVFGAPILVSTAMDTWDAVGPDAGSAVDAYYNIGLVNDWWRERGRQSYDGKGSAIKIVTHDNTEPGSRASWDPRTRDLHIVPAAYDKGRGLTPPPASVSLDGMGHEFQHGVNQFSFHLDYASFQAANLDESLGDVFGNFIEHEHHPDDVKNFLFGEDLYPGGYRDLANPHSWKQPDNVSDPFVYTGNDKYQAQHSNTGIPNNAWYLALHGGTNSTSGVEVSPDIALDWDVAENVYVMMVNGPSLAPLSTFDDFAHQLLGKALAFSSWNWNGAPTGVACAWYAVGVFSKQELEDWGIHACLDKKDAGRPSTVGCGAQAGSISDGGAAAARFCPLVPLATVAAMTGVSGLTGPVTLSSSSTMVPAAEVDAAVCAYCANGAVQLQINYIYSNVDTVVSQSFTEFPADYSAAACTVSAGDLGKQSVAASCPQSDGQPAARAYAMLADDTDIVAVTSYDPDIDPRSVAAFLLNGGP
jgi:hypothetical protein